MRAKEKGYAVKLINPLITNKYSQHSIRKTKTDAIDARLIRYCVKPQSIPRLLSKEKRRGQTLPGGSGCDDE